MINTPLLPNRHPEADLFILDVGDVVLKDDLASMEHPVFSLSKKPDITGKIYEHNGNSLEVTPSIKGLANIYDKDILIFAISHIIAAKNKGENYSKNVAFDAHDFLVFSNRHTGGRDYKLLKDALERLAGTRIITNIKTNNERIVEGFGLIDKFRVRTTLDDGTVTSWRVTLSDWLFNAIEANEVLSINSDYFRLRKPLERRVYEIARKHCGLKNHWSINIELLQKKCGSTSPKRNFRVMLKNITEHQHLPDYQVMLEGNMVTFHRTGKVGNSEAIEVKQANLSYDAIPPFSPKTLEKAGEMCRTKGLDKYALEYEWREWASHSPSSIQNVNAAFLGFVKMKVEQAG